MYDRAKAKRDLMPVKPKYQQSNFYHPSLDNAVRPFQLDSPTISVPYQIPPELQALLDDNNFVELDRLTRNMLLPGSVFTHIEECRSRHVEQQRRDN
jgi:hypothetical protein